MDIFAEISTLKHEFWITRQNKRMKSTVLFYRNYSAFSRSAARSGHRCCRVFDLIWFDASSGILISSRLVCPLATIYYYCIMCRMLGAFNCLLHVNCCECCCRLSVHGCCRWVEACIDLQSIFSPYRSETSEKRLKWSRVTAGIIQGFERFSGCFKLVALLTVELPALKLSLVDIYM